MNDKLTFADNSFSLVFANLSIHYFNHNDTRKLMGEINRILVNDGIFMGSVNSIEGYQYIKDSAIKLEPHFYYYNLKNIRLFSKDDLEKYLNNFSILELKEKEIVRFTHKKNYIIFVAKKCK